MIQRMSPAHRLTLLALLITVAGCSPAASETPAGGAAAPPVTSRAVQHACAACHAEQSRFHAYGAHAEVTCARCHGCEGDHTATEIEVVMPGNAGCLACHPLDSGERGADGVFERHLRWVEKKHVVEVDRSKAGDRCISCHDPHLGE